MTRIVNKYYVALALDCDFSGHRAGTSSSNEESRPKAAFNSRKSLNLCAQRDGAVTTAHLQADSAEADDHHSPGRQFRDAGHADIIDERGVVGTYGPDE